MKNRNPDTHAFTSVKHKVALVKSRDDEVEGVMALLSGSRRRLHPSPGDEFVIFEG